MDKISQFLRAYVGPLGSAGSMGCSARLAYPVMSQFLWAPMGCFGWAVSMGIPRLVGAQELMPPAPLRHVMLSELNNIFGGVDC